MLVVDAQVHVWAAESPERAWPPGGPARAAEHRHVTPEVLLAEMDAAGVDRAVLVPPSFEGDRNDMILSAARTHPWRFAAMGRIALDDRAGAERVLDGWRDHPGALGFRLTFSPGFNATRGVKGSWLTDGTAEWFWRRAGELGLPVMVYCAGQLEALGEVATRHPDLRLVVDHFGIAPTAKDAEADAAVTDTCRLSDRPNVAVKASAAPVHTSEAYPFPAMQENVRRLVAAFGAERVFWGSDLSRLPCPYAEVVDLFRRECGFLDDRERELVLGRGILDWLGWI